MTYLQHPQIDLPERALPNRFEEPRCFSGQTVRGPRARRSSDRPMVNSVVLLMERPAPYLFNAVSEEQAVPSIEYGPAIKLLVFIGFLGLSIAFAATALSFVPSLSSARDVVLWALFPSALALSIGLTLARNRLRGPRHG
jgi:hypothetical protein